MLYLCNENKTKGVVKRFESSFTYTIYIREYMKKASSLELAFLFIESIQCLRDYLIDSLIVIWLLISKISKRQLTVDSSIERNNRFAA